MLLGGRAVSLLALVLLVMAASLGAQVRQVEASVASVSNCSCECVEGLPTTLCASVQAAQQQTWECPPSYTCPLPSISGVGDTSLPENVVTDVGQPQASSLTPPHPQAENCRAVRVWHRQMQAYTTVNICDVQAPRT